MVSESSRTKQRRAIGASKCVVPHAREISKAFLLYRFYSRRSTRAYACVSVGQWGMAIELCMKRPPRGVKTRNPRLLCKAMVLLPLFSAEAGMEQLWEYP